MDLLSVTVSDIYNNCLLSYYQQIKFSQINVNI